MREASNNLEAKSGIRSPAHLQTEGNKPRSKRILRKVLLGLDLLLLAALVFVTVKLPWKPLSQAPEHILGPALRLGVTALFASRMLFRLVPHLLNGIEGLNIKTLLAARHLRAPKSNSFLAAISILSLLAVSFSSCALTTTLSVMGGFRNDLKSKILGNHAHVVVKPKEGELNAFSKVVKRVRKVEGVTGASPYLGGEVMVTSASNLAGVILRGIETSSIESVSDLGKNVEKGSLSHLDQPEKIKAPSLKDLDLENSRRGGSKTKDGTKGLTMPMQPKDGLLDDEFAATGDDLAPVAPGLLVGRELARILRLTVGDEVQLVAPFGALGPSGPMPKSKSFRIAGVFYSGMYEYDMKHVYVSLPVAQNFLGKGSVASGVEVKTKNVDKAPQLAAAIRQTLKGSSGSREQGFEVKDWQELNRNLFGALALEKVAMFITLGIAILVAGFCVFGTLTLMVQEKTREVAILKALGATRRTIVSVFMTEGFLLGALGSIVGTGLGFLVCFLAQHFGIRLDPEIYYIDRLPVHIDPMEFVLVSLCAVLVCLFATVFPAFIASAAKPAEALRYE